MPRVPTPTGVKIKALEKQREDRTDLMHPGTGIAWEDRGRLGAIRAFVKTAGGVMARPGGRRWEMRGDDTRAEASGFVGIVGVVCGLGDAVQAAWARFMQNAEMAPAQIAEWVIFVGCATIAPWLLAKVGSRLYASIAAPGLRNRVSPSLMDSIFFYIAAPAVFMLVPIAGPWIALVGTVLMVLIAPRLRLKLTMPEGTIAGALASATMGGIAIGGYLLLAWVLPRMLGVWLG